MFNEKIEEQQSKKFIKHNRYTFLTLPQVLVIRCEYSKDAQTKCINRTRFPTQLSLDNFVDQSILENSQDNQQNSEESENSKQTQLCKSYTLLGFVVHIGPAGSGHFFTIMKPISKSNTQWIKCDDSTVSYIDQQSIISIDPDSQKEYIKFPEIQQQNPDQSKEFQESNYLYFYIRDDYYNPQNNLTINYPKYLLEGSLIIPHFHQIKVFNFFPFSFTSLSFHVH